MHNKNEKNQKYDLLNLNGRICLSNPIKHHNNLNYSGCNSGFYVDCSHVIIICTDLNSLILHYVPFGREILNL